MPDNYLYLGLLAVLFPQAVFIHCRRDLRDVAVSCWMTDFRSIRWANHPDHIATRFQQYRRLMDHWREVLPVPIHHVDYEETVTDLESVARRLIAACGLDWEPACLEFHRTERPVRTASVSQVRQPVYQRSVARWKNYEGALGEPVRGGEPRRWSSIADGPNMEEATRLARTEHGCGSRHGGWEQCGRKRFLTTDGTDTTDRAENNSYSPEADGVDDGTNTN